MKSATLTAAALVVVYTWLISSADAITKQLAESFAAPQLYAMSGVIVVALCLLGMRLRAQPVRQSLRTSCARAMAVRSAATVVGAVAFFYAFATLGFAEVFVFIGLMPLFAGLLSGPILGEQISPGAWGAMLAGFIGVFCLFPMGLGDITWGHGIALIAAMSGTLSMILARYIGARENNPLAQVFYPNLALALVMALALPFVFRPMGLADLGWVVAYSVLLFFARWVLVRALSELAAYAVTTLMKLQFIWMVLIGAFVFGEWPAANVYVGAAIVIGSGLFMLYDLRTGVREKVTPTPGLWRVRTSS